MLNKTDFCLQLKKFVLHCRIVANNSRNPGYKTYARAKALDQALALINADLSTKPVNVIARQVVKNESSLRAILPAVNNASYKSSLLKLEQMIHESQEVLMASNNATQYS
jgi:hypothetical protein